MMPIFFFSSRRRHTISLRDWSSDVCSSDLSSAAGWPRAAMLTLPPSPNANWTSWPTCSPVSRRSEERRVGKECSSLWPAYYEKEQLQGCPPDVLIKMDDECARYFG